MEDILVPIGVLAIIFGCIYKLFELFVGRKERIMLIEKLQPEQLSHGVAGHLKFSTYPRISLPCARVASCSASVSDWWQAIASTLKPAMRFPRLSMPPAYS